MIRDNDIVFRTIDSYSKTVLYGTSWSEDGRSSENSSNEEDEDSKEEEEEEEEEEETSFYEQKAESEFLHSSGHAITQYNKPNQPSTDWGGEYDKLRSRMQDMTLYNNNNNNSTLREANALFRTMTMESPNEAIVSFVNSASPEVVTAMSAAVTSLLGGLASSTSSLMGMETIVKANGEKLGSLCFQLQMTGYMFRNAEYVLALRDLMNLKGSQVTLEDYKKAFDKMDVDGSGYIETDEIEQLLEEVYGVGETPALEVDTFMDFFDVNQDGKISWEEFERGLGAVAKDQMEKKKKNSKNTRNNASKRNSKEDGTKKTNSLWDRSLLSSSSSKQEEEQDYEDDNDDELDDLLGEPTVSGVIDVEMKNGKIIQVEAKEYIQELRREAEALKSALALEKGGVGSSGGVSASMDVSSSKKYDKISSSSQVSLSSYIASLGGDIQTLTKGISPVVVESMKMLVNFVIDGGPSGRNGRFKDVDRKQLEMEIPGPALQQLALWQLVLGYKLREAEATGEYRKMLE